MIGIFKTDSFDQAQLQKLCEVFEKQEEVQIKWKSNNKTEVQDSAQANELILEQNGQWFFRQKGKSGRVRFHHLEEHTKNELLKVLAKQQSFTKPDWITSWFIFTLFLIVGLLSFAAEKTGILLFIGILQFVIVSRLGSRGKAPYKAYRISLWIGLVSLCIPVLTAIVYFISTIVEILIYTKDQFSSMYPTFNYDTYFSGLLWIVPFVLVLGVLPIPLIKAYHQDYIYRKIQSFLPKQPLES